MPKTKRDTAREVDALLAAVKAPRAVGMADAIKHPTLTALLTSGLVTISSDGREYVGHASDGAAIAVGSVGDERATERYLAANPSPTQW